MAPIVDELDSWMVDTCSDLRTPAFFQKTINGECLCTCTGSPAFIRKRAGL